MKIYCVKIVYLELYCILEVEYILVFYKKLYIFHTIESVWQIHEFHLFRGFSFSMQNISTQ